MSAEPSIATQMLTWKCRLLPSRGQHDKLRAALGHTLHYALYVLVFPHGKIYVGMSAKPKQRWNSHARSARQGSALPVHAAIRRYGWGAVEKRIIAIGSRDYIADLEIKAIEAFGTRKRTRGYNVSMGGDISPMTLPEVIEKVRLASSAPEAIGRLCARNKAKVWTEEERDKISRTSIGRIFSEESRAKMRAAQLGKKKTPEHIALVAATLVGRKLSPETRQRISEARAGKGTGKRSLEWCQHLSESQKGRMTPEQRKQISDRNRSRITSPETRQRMSESHKGARLSPVTRQRIADGVRRHWAEKGRQAP